MKTSIEVRSLANLRSLERERAELDTLNWPDDVSVPIAAQGGSRQVTLAHSAVREQPVGDTRCIGYAFADALEAWLLQHNPGWEIPARLSVSDADRGVRGYSLRRGARNATAGITDVSCYPDAPGSHPCANIERRRYSASVDGLQPRGYSLQTAACEALEAGYPLVGAIPIWPDFREHRTEALSPYVPAPRQRMRGAHAVSVIGYQINGITGQGHWLAKNTWGVSWGHDGFTLLRWNDRNIGIERSFFVIKQVRVP